jgi:hypothetical protein
MFDSLEYYGGGHGMGDMLPLLAAEDLMRKKRSTDNVRQKRQVGASLQYQSLVGNCYGNRPSIDIAANDRTVKLSLLTDRSRQPGELILPIVRDFFFHLYFVAFLNTANEFKLLFECNNYRFKDGMKLH